METPLFVGRNLCLLSHHIHTYLKQGAMTHFGRDLLYVVAVGFKLPQPDALPHLRRQGLELVA